MKKRYVFIKFGIGYKKYSVLELYDIIEKNGYITIGDDSIYSVVEYINCNKYELEHVETNKDGNVGFMVISKMVEEKPIDLEKRYGAKTIEKEDSNKEKNENKTLKEEPINDVEQSKEVNTEELIETVEVKESDNPFDDFEFGEEIDLTKEIKKEENKNVEATNVESKKDEDLPQSFDDLFDDFLF